LRTRTATVLAVAIIALSLTGCSNGGGGQADRAVATATTVTTRPRPSGPVPRVSTPSPRTARATPSGLASPVDLAAHGYVEEELLLAGTATAYGRAGEWGKDGRWTATPTTTAPYTTRAVVRRPTLPSRFNGTVVVEWLNVTSGRDASPDFGYEHAELLRSGYIWVGVSAQSVGVTSTRQEDPTRYKDLQHPGDAYAYDIFTQVGRAVRAGELFDKKYGVRAVIAAGDSQSAILLTTYVNAIDPLVDMYDGFLVHSRFGASAGLGNDGKPGPDGAYIRDDTDAPVLIVLTETDVGFNLDTRQPDSDHVRLWEIAGTAHADQYLLDLFLGRAPGEPPANPLGCPTPLNSANAHWVLKAALAHLNTWVRGGPPPAHAARLEMSASNPRRIARDADGNALGGIRLPDLEAPTATLSGTATPGSPGFCTLFGSTTPFTAPRVAQLYANHDAYVSKYAAAVDRLVAAGFMLEPDAVDAKAAARATLLPL
jgi:hypothetical protein